MDNSTTPVLDVGALRKRVVGRITLEDGSEHDVLQIRGRTQQSLKAAGAGDALDRLYAAVPEVVPTLTADAALDLTVDQAKAILAIATAGVQAAETLFPNLTSPERTAPSALTSPG